MTIDVLVITDYESLVALYSYPETRKRNGVLVTPFDVDGKKCLPLGWEGELTTAGIAFTTETVTISEE